MTIPAFGIGALSAQRDAQFQVMMNNQSRLDLVSNPSGLSFGALHAQDKAEI